MPLSPEVIQSIAIAVIETLSARFSNFPDDHIVNRNAPFHQAFLQAFSDRLGGTNTNATLLISLSSWLHGLNTTLGQKFFEKVANELCAGEKREWTSGRDGNLQITTGQKNAISRICTQLSNSEVLPCLAREDGMIAQAAIEGAMQNAIDFSADVFYVSDNEVVAIEMKSVKPNSGELKGEKQKILEGKAALAHLYPNNTITFYLGFPFDPTVPAGDDPCSSDKDRFVRSIVNGEKFFAKEEILLASELWDFLSGQPNTMQEILAIINRIATPEFETKYRCLKNPHNSDVSVRLNVAQEWFLIDETSFMENMEALSQFSLSDRKLGRLLPQGCFKNDNHYDSNRANYLMQTRFWQ